MPQKVNSRLLALGGGTFLTCAVGYFGFYLPFYSSAALENRKRRGRLQGQQTGKQQADKRPNSVWGNIDAATKRVKQQKKNDAKRARKNQAQEEATRAAAARETQA